jgi:hypothetical protein
MTTILNSLKMKLHKVFMNKEKEDVTIAHEMSAWLLWTINNWKK